jgi:hypothetical protein
MAITIQRENLSHKQVITIAHTWAIDNPGKYGYVRICDSKTGQMVWHTQIGATANGLLTHIGRMNVDKAMKRIERRLEDRNRDTRNLKFDVDIKLDFHQTEMADSGVAQ